jgi:hypothetical protein
MRVCSLAAAERKDDEADLIFAALLSIINARRREAELIGLDPEPKDITPGLDQYLSKKKPDEA